MPGMNMHSAATVHRTRTPGQYRAQVKPGMAGDWTATLHYEAPRGSGDLTFSVNVKQRAIRVLGPSRTARVLHLRDVELT
jgi:hypothetical protein